jgi:hypothetical protein
MASDKLLWDTSLLTHPFPPKSIKSASKRLKEPAIKALEIALGGAFLAQIAKPAKLKKPLMS